MNLMHEVGNMMFPERGCEENLFASSPGFDELHGPRDLRHVPCFPAYRANPNYMGSPGRRFVPIDELPMELIAPGSGLDERLEIGSQEWCEAHLDADLGACAPLSTFLTPDEMCSREPGRIEGCCDFMEEAPVNERIPRRVPVFQEIRGKHGPRKHFVGYREEFIVVRVKKRRHALIPR